MFTEQVIQRVRAFRAKKGWTLNKFATQAGITESTIRKMDDDGWNPEVKTLQKLEAVIAAEEKGPEAA